MNLTDPTTAKILIAYGTAASLVALAFVTTLTDAPLNETILHVFAGLIGTLLVADKLTGSTRGD